MRFSCKNSSVKIAKKNQMWYIYLTLLNKMGEVCEMNKEVLAKEIIDTFETVNTERLLENIKFTVKGENILLLLLEDFFGGESIPSKLIEKLDYSAARLSAVIKSLEAKGYVVTIRNDKDKRSKIIALTDSGAAYCRELRCEMTRNALSVVEELGEEDTAELLRIFRRFAGLYSAQ